MFWRIFGYRLDMWKSQGTNPLDDPIYAAYISLGVKVRHKIVETSIYRDIMEPNPNGMGCYPDIITGRELVRTDSSLRFRAFVRSNIFNKVSLETGRETQNYIQPFILISIAFIYFAAGISITFWMLWKQAEESPGFSSGPTIVDAPFILFLAALLAIPSGIFVGVLILIVIENIASLWSRLRKPSGKT